MKRAYGIEAELQTGALGSFDIAVNGRVVVSKSVTGFPSDDEIVQAVGKALGKA